MGCFVVRTLRPKPFALLDGNVVLGQPGKTLIIDDSQDGSPAIVLGCKTGLLAKVVETIVPEHVAEKVEKLVELQTQADIDSNDSKIEMDEVSEESEISDESVDEEIAEDVDSKGDDVSADDVGSTDTEEKPESKPKRRYKRKK